MRNAQILVADSPPAPGTRNQSFQNLDLRAFLMMKGRAPQLCVYSEIRRKPGIDLSFLAHPRIIVIRVRPKPSIAVR